MNAQLLEFFNLIMKAPMPYRLLLAMVFAALTISLPASADTMVTRTGPASSIVSNAIWVGDHLYLSGEIATPTKPEGKPEAKPVITGDTQTQAISTLKAIQNSLQQQGLDMADIVQMRVYLVGDPRLGGKMDFAGWNQAYRQFFGTPEQANKPVRTTVQVAALALPEALVEIEVMAVNTGKTCATGQTPCKAIGQAASGLQRGSCRQQNLPGCRPARPFANAVKTRQILL
ncbi:enamine deaminase RidA (YjgF/YER057c/UK114 family) [Undibacterium pigrum]|uniref:Enamine deaminase RidA (YjgF/YER057c/UK114 family) n=2 Tax=Undibacterium pigrum TaxID=401470 RepID=A0A318IX42_9BURK|nr:enamine deaminase RidA (YjgF/YER057c/UK114 family) [Undibacterium pigrum]